ncbi:hypothetical protein SAV31267_033800 [Streptomyces avermitilis]|uniref:Guanylate cyclase domain-containing protein n=1 Tax=Streptomyces avermitilis TaxID=33903 RepID=A0A4D4MQY7_STRAX|nr:hypothetical protein SAV31267_033800 [Streptomyces avermitilis]
MARYRRRLCLAVDLRQYSRHGYRAQEDAQYRLRLVVEHALRRARVLRVRAQQQVQGDGQLVVFPAGIDAVRVVPALILGLRDGLYQANRTPGAFGRMRMRAALALGSVSRADRGYLGDSVVLVNRLVDADGLRDALENEDGSDLALAVPDEMYRDVILPDGRGLAAGFHRIDVAVVKKDFGCGAWLHVPPSAPVRDSRPEPVIWGHSPGRTAMREFVVPALGAAHVAAAVVSHGQTLREWALTGPDTGVSYGGGGGDFDGPDEADPRDADRTDGHYPGRQRHQPGDHHGSGHHASGHHASGHHASGPPGAPGSRARIMLPRITGTRTTPIPITPVRTIRTRITPTRITRTWVTLTRTIRTRITPTRTTRTCITPTRTTRTWITPTRTTRTRTTPIRATTISITTIRDTTTPATTSITVATE